MLNVAVTIALLVFLVTSRAGADSLLTGAIRDRAGAPIPGARITAFDAAGRTVGVVVASADGTFAVAAPSDPATILISCDYCEPVRRAVVAGEPVVVIVERFGAVTARGPSPADIRALPYRRSSDIASLIPLTVVDDERIADRGLARYGAVSIDGLPFYDPADGRTAGDLLPAHAPAGLTAGSPLLAPVYGGYAAAGVYDLHVNDPDLSTSRFDLGNAADVAGRLQAPDAGADYVASSDPDGDRQALSADARARFAGGRLSFNALDLAGTGGHASGAGLVYAVDSRRFATAGSLLATQTDDSSLVALAAQCRDRGPLGLEFGLRATRATTALEGAGAVQFDAALYAAAARQTAAGMFATTIAWEQGGDSGVAPGLHGSALVGSIADDLRLSAHWTAHLGAVSNLRIPTFAEVPAVAPSAPAGDRSLLFEQSFTYTDLRRLRLTASTYAQRTTGPAAGKVAGIGVDAGWQIAPQLSLRSWLLVAHQTATPAPAAVSPYLPSPSTSATDLPPIPGVPDVSRRLIWFTYERWIRVDALVSAGALEGDVRIPLGANYAVALGTSHRDGRRLTTFGLTRR